MTRPPIREPLLRMLLAMDLPARQAENIADLLFHTVEDIARQSYRQGFGAAANGEDPAAWVTA